MKGRFIGQLCGFITQGRLIVIALLLFFTYFALLIALPQNGVNTMLRLYSSRLLMLGGIAFACYYSYNAHTVNKPFDALLQQQCYPHTLAIFRICVFLIPALFALYPGSSISGWMLEEWIDLPVSERKPLPFMDWYSMHVPVGRQIADTIQPFYKLVSVMGLLGLFTRFSTISFAICNFYIYSIMSLYGKPVNNQHMFWFPAILALSDCGRVFSADYLLRQYWHKNTTPVTRGAQYYYPILCIWLLLGVFYFFPGFWKIWTSGFDWIFKGYLKGYLYLKWHELNNWQPLFRIDQYPVMLVLAAAATIVFEIGFIFGVLHRKWRLVLIPAGMLFHGGVYLMMQISFFQLFQGYVVLLNFDRLASKSAGSRNAPPYNHKAFNWQLAVFGFILTGNALMGVLKTNSFPFACYPAFDTEVKVTGFEVIVYEANCNHRIVYDAQLRNLLNKHYTSYNLQAREFALLKAANRSDSLKAITEAKAITAALQQILACDTVYFYKTQLGNENNPKTRTKLLQISP
ncbi:hypothetical protein C7N43_05185 [Sphingobacteriales bacterium UPWRP_1]|nr:hypothetical protein BVG80_09675 [Sphingobacteriales bacterium TSM_CSM]PSJ78096.1 hypothetical protein C7N43_05185 [Sphingobacteriales bacterium UPWRP_1]